MITVWVILQIGILKRQIPADNSEVMSPVIFQEFRKNGQLKHLGNLDLFYYLAKAQKLHTFLGDVK